MPWKRCVQDMRWLPSVGAGCRVGKVVYLASICIYISGPYGPHSRLEYAQIISNRFAKGSYPNSPVFGSALLVLWVRGGENPSLVCLTVARWPLCPWGGCNISHMFLCLGLLVIQLLTSSFWHAEV